MEFIEINSSFHGINSNYLQLSRNSLTCRSSKGWEREMAKREERFPVSGFVSNCILATFVLGVHRVANPFKRARAANRSQDVVVERCL